MILTARALARPPMLAPVDLALAPGDLVGVVGPNGAGKTTLLRALAGLSDGPGEVFLDGQPLAGLAPAVRARRLAWLPAARDIAWPMRAADIVALGLLPLGVRDPDAVAAALAAVDALPFAGRNVQSLSTGERARVLLARALVARPRVLLLDEPVANLDPHHRLAVFDTLRAAADAGAAVLLAIHDLDLARQRCDRLLLLDRGRLAASGAPGAVLGPDALAAVFRVRAAADGWHRA